MPSSDELVICTLMCGLGIFLIANRRRVGQVPHAALLILSFISMLLGTILTIAENFALTTEFNIGEHISYLVSSIFLAAWSYRALVVSRFGIHD